MSSRGMRSIGEVIASKNIITRLHKKDIRREILLKAWEQIKGNHWKEHTENVALKNGVLCITLDSQLWQQELSFHDTDTMVKAMAEKTGFTIVKIKIKAGGDYSRYA